MHGAPAKSWQSVKINIPYIDVQKSVEEQSEELNKVFEAARHLRDFFIKHKRSLLGIPTTSFSKPLESKASETNIDSSSGASMTATSGTAFKRFVSALTTLLLSILVPLVLAGSFLIHLAQAGSKTATPPRRRSRRISDRTTIG